MTNGRGMWRLAAACALAGHVGAAPAAAQVRTWPSERPPRPLAAKPVTFPPYEFRTLENGLQVIAVSHHEQPAVSLRLVVRVGGADDPPDRSGLASLAAALLDQGTTTRSAPEIAGTIDSIGGALGTGAGTDLSFVSAVVLKDSFDLALTMVSDIVRRPAFAPQEIERQRQQVLSGLRVSYEDPDHVARLVIDRLIYGFHPYGRPASGTPESIPRITRDDLLAFHERHYAPNNAILAIVGDVTAAEAFAGAERAFGDWPRRAVDARDFPEPPPPTRRLLIVDRPGAVQTEIRVGHLGVPRKHPDYMALNLAIKILGGEGSNRLHRVLRTERGLTYGASADMETRRQSGGFVAETDTRSEATAEALRLIVDEFWRLQRERVHPRELADAQAYLTGNFPLTIETPGAIALQILNAVFYGLDLKELETFRERVNAVTVDDIHRVARTYLKPDRLSIALVGDASTFVDQLRAAGFDRYEKVSLAELDLSAVDFRRPAVPAAGPSARRISIRGPSTVARRPAGAADRLIARAVEAKGGLDLLRSIRTARATTVTVLHAPAGPVTAKTTTYIAYPDRFRVEATLDAGRIVQVYAEGRAWIRDPAGVREAPPPMRDEFEASVRRDVIPLLLRAADGEATLRLLDDERAEDGRRLQAVEVSLPALDPVTLLIDAGTGLIASQRYTSDGPDGRGTTEEIFSDYRPVDGLQVAFTAVVRRGGTVIIERAVDAFEVNVPLEPELFGKPV